MRDTSGSGDQDAAPLCPSGQMLHEAILPRVEDIVFIPNTQKQAQRDKQNEETKSHAPSEGKGAISSMRTK